MMNPTLVLGVVVTLVATVLFELLRWGARAVYRRFRRPEQDDDIEQRVSTGAKYLLTQAIEREIAKHDVSRRRP